MSRDPLREALAALREANRELDLFSESIAIVGVGRRLPSQHSPWELLAAAHDATRDFDASRRLNRKNTKPFRASLLDSISEFDARYFEISPVEAVVIDPQQRIALETTQDALDGAGIGSSLARRTGVFIGATHVGYVDGREVPPESISFTATGGLLGTVAGRISYAFGFNGPSITTETACSSSLVTIHQACDSLRLDQCDVAIAGGINILISEQGMELMASVGATSPDGRCKAFDASADGYGRGEGCGILVLKRVSDATRDGDRIWGVVKGYAANQDGRSASLSAPNVLAQQEVLRSALDSAQLSAPDVQYVEAHGTGTVLGDPIEVEALAAVYGEGRTAANPLHIGTIKTNIGHLEYAAGVAGIVKVLLSIRHRQLPPNLHFKTPNPHIPWDTIPIKVQTELTSWPEPGRPLIAGVSSFGITGTNAHVILSEPPPEPFEKWAEADALAKQELTLPLAISAKTPKALKEYAERFLELLDAPEDPSYFTTWRDIAHTSTVRRQHLEERLVVVGKSKEDWKEKLRTYLQGEEGIAGIAKGNGKETKSRLVFVFPGQGAQWLGMGRSLLKTNLAFQTEVAQVEKAFSKHVDWTLREEIEKADPSHFDRLDIIQPLLFAMAAGLAAAFKSLGIEPTCVVGHSQGEVAAAYVAGALSLDDAARIICLRSRLVENTRGKGHMAVVGLPMAEAEKAIARYEGALSIAASNGPTTTIVSGDAAAVEDFAAGLEKLGTFVRVLKVGYASHSRQMDSLKAELLGGLSSLRPLSPKIRFATTALLPGTEPGGLDANYWWNNLRNPVRFHERIAALAAEGFDLFLELSPHPGLLSSIQDTLAALKGNGARTASSLLRDRDENTALLTSLGALHAHGYPVDWKRVFTNKDGNYVWGRVAELPNYPWQRQRYWLPEKKEKKAFDSKWPFIHAHTESASHPGEHIFQVELDLSDEKFAYLKDHKVQGAIWFPGAGFLEMALEVGSELLGNKFSGLSNIVLKESLVLSDTEPTLVQFIVSPKDDDPQHPKGALPFSISSKTKGDSTAPWALHASGRLNTERLAPGDMPRFADVRNRANAELQAADLYSAFEDVELSYGPTFQGLISLATGEGEAIGKLSPPSTLSDIKVYRAHPALLDAAFQASTGALASLNLEQTFVPATIGQVRTLDSTASAAYALIKLRNNDPKNLSVDVYLLDKDAKLLAEVLALGLKPIGQAQDKLDKWMWEVLWKSVPLAKDEDAQGPWLLVQDHSGMADSLKALLEAKHQKVVLAPQNFSENDFYLRFLKEHFPKSPPKKLVLLSALDVPDGLSLEAAKKGEELACLSPLFLLQAVIQMQSSWDLAPKLFLVSKNAQPPVAAPAQALLWGLGACIPHELPELHTALIDIDASTSPQQLLHELTHSDNENRVALRNTNNLQDRLAQRLEKHRRNVDATPPTFPADKTVLITGGFGGLGPVVVSTLADLGAKHFALVGRTGASENTQKTLDALALEKHISIYPLKANIADNAQVAALPAQLLQLGAPAPFALVHAAVVLRDATIANQSTALVREALAPKVDGLLALLNAFRFEKIIHFSSASGLLGNGGQANYAAANALLDASAHYLHAHNTQALSLNWGAWADIGAATSSVITDNLARQGITAISPQQGAILLERSLAASPSLQQLSPFAISPNLWKKANAKAAHIPLFGESSTAQEGPSELLKKLRTLHSQQEKEALLLAHVIELTKSISKASDVYPDSNLKELGFDSLMVVSLKNRLEAELKLQVPTATIYSAKNIGNLSEIIAHQLSQSLFEEQSLDLQPEQTAPTPATSAQPQPDNLAPIAIVSISGKTPLGSRPWEALSLMKDGVSDAQLQLERFDLLRHFDPSPDAKGKSYARRAAFIPFDEVGSFEPAMFHLAPAEVTEMDPQQRLALELSYNILADIGALENTALLARTGVFLGANSYDSYSSRIVDIQSVAGSGGLAFTAGRVSFAFGLNGPAMTVDTVCSSSLVATHLAVDALRNKTCDLALAGGVSIMAAAETFIMLSHIKAIAPDGRSKTFDASADGFGRGEGGVIFALKRLADAERDGDHILAIIRGTAVNQDGKSMAMSAPNGQAQQEVVRTALKAAKLTPTDIQYVEAHGTGTVLGDPIEVEALAAVYGEGRTAANPLHIGTIKTNIGHLEAAAGGAGLLKVLLSIRHRQLPPNLHFKTPNPHIPWDSIPIKVQTELTSWPEPGRPLIAGVSSFGMSGTNAHVILSEPPPEPFEKWAEADALAKQELTLPLAISAKTPKALKEYAERFLELLDAPEDPSYFTTWRDIAHTSTVRRQHLEERLVVVGKSKEDWKEKLRTYLQGQSDDTAQGISTANGKESRSRLVVVFSGQGAQWWAMGRELFKNPVFQKSITECSDLAKKHSGWSIEEELLKDEASSRLSDTAFAQPCIVALQASLFALYKHWGVAPSAVVGHSIGEVSACYAAGVFTLDEALRLAVVRGRIMSEATGLGKMASVSLSEKECLPYLERINGLSVGAINSPNATVISGTTEAIATLLKTLAENGTQAKELKVDYAFHSAQMQPFLPKLEKELAFLLPKQPTTRIVSTLSGKEEKEAKESAAFGPAYWARQMRDPVRFLEATKTLLLADYDLFLELSPHPVLSLGIEETAESEKKNTVAALYSLKRHADDAVASLTSLGALHAHGYPVDWKRVFTNKDGNYVWGRVAELPNYPWQRQRYWLPEKKEKKAFDSKWPFIHAHTESASHPGEHIFQVELDLSDEKFAYLKDHKVQGAIWFPGAGFLEMALEVGSELLGNKFSGLSNIVLKESLVLSDTEPTLVQFIVSPKDDDPQHPKGALPFSISSKTKGDSTAPWALHASGRLNTERLAPGDMPRFADVRNRANAELQAADLYSAFEDVELSYGPTFQGLISLATGEGEAIGKLSPPSTLSDIKVYRAHPALLDAAFQASTGALASLNLEQTFVPATIGQVRTLDSTASAAYALIKLRNNDPKNLSVDVYLLDKDAKLLAEVLALGLKPIGQAQDKLDKWMWEVLWKSVPLAKDEDAQGPWLLVQDHSGMADSLKALLEAKHQKVVLAPQNFSENDFYLRFLKEHFPKSPPKKLVLLSALDVPDGLSLEAAKKGEELACLSPLFLLQAVIQMQSSWDLAPKLFLVSKNAQPPVAAPAQALLWGLGACIPHELPELHTALIDIDASTSPQQLLHELTHSDNENRVALRNTNNLQDRLAQRLEKHRRNVDATPPTFPADKTVLITGGFGGLGPVVVSTLADLGAKHFALVGRTGASENTQKTLDALALEKHISIYPLKANIADNAQVAALPAQLLQLGAPAPFALVHAAVVLRDATIANQSTALVREALAPKVDGLLALLNAFRFEKIIHFSSASGLLGNGGQANYAAANALLDASAHYLHAHNTQALSLNWGAWADIGAATSSVITDNLARQGITAISPQQGAILLERSLAASPSLQQLSPFAISPNLWKKANAKAAHIPLFGESSTAQEGPSELLKKLRTLHSQQEKEALLLAHVIELTKSISKASDVYPDSNLKELGFDSLMVVSLKNRLEAELKLQVPTATIYSAKNLLSLSSSLNEKLEPLPTVGPEPKAETKTEANTRRAEAPISGLTEISLADKLAQLELEDG